MILKVGDIRRIKKNQDYTCVSACGCVCVIYSVSGNECRARVQLETGEHIDQYVAEFCLEEI